MKSYLIGAIGFCLVMLMVLSIWFLGLFFIVQPGETRTMGILPVAIVRPAVNLETLSNIEPVLIEKAGQTITYTFVITK